MFIHTKREPMKKKTGSRVTRMTRRVLHAQHTHVKKTRRARCAGWQQVNAAAGARARVRRLVSYIPATSPAYSRNFLSAKPITPERFAVVLYFFGAHPLMLDLLAAFRLAWCFFLTLIFELFEPAGAGVSRSIYAIRTAPLCQCALCLINKQTTRVPVSCVRRGTKRKVKGGRTRRAVFSRHERRGAVSREKTSRRFSSAARFQQGGTRPVNNRQASFPTQHKRKIVPQ